MIIIYKLAKKIYEKSLQLKKYNSNNLLFKKNRLALEKDLYLIKEMNNDILHTLYGNTNYSVESYELALFISETLTECIMVLQSKGKIIEVQ